MAKSRKNGAKPLPAGLPEDGTIDDVQRHLIRWATIAPEGLARVEFTSEFSRAELCRRIESVFRESNLPFVEIVLPTGRPAEEVVRALIRQLRSTPKGVVSLSGFEAAFHDDATLADAIRLFNFNRENLARPGIRQLWWMTPPFADALMAVAPDLDSWFIVRVRLTQVDVRTETAEREREPLNRAPEIVAAARRRAKSLSRRIDRALERDDAEPTEIWQLLAAATSSLLEAGDVLEANSLLDTVRGKLNSRGLSDTPDHPQVLNAIARIAYLSKRMTEAATLALRALEITNVTRDLKSRELSLTNLGLIYSALGQPRKAISCHEQALAISREIGDRRGETNSLGNLGNTYAEYSEPVQAIQHYVQALATAREIGDSRGEASYLGNLGNLYAEGGQTRKAIGYDEQALAVSREIGDRRGEGARLGDLGTAYAKLGEPRKAIAYHEQALVITREIGDRRGEGICLGNLGNALAKLGEPRKAIVYYEHALVLLDETEDPYATVVRSQLSKLTAPSYPR